MFVMTAKLSKPKLIAAGVILLGIILSIVMLLSGGKDTTSPLPTGGTDEERAAYLGTFGWSINAVPKETQTVTIPNAEDNKVFARYNELQVSQGFDLLKYAGKEVTRFVYEILNYPNATAPVYAGVLVHEGRIIGGEITDTSPEGVIHGFKKPGSLSDSTEQEPTTPTEAGTTVPTEAGTTVPTEAETTAPTEAETTASPTPTH